MSELRDLERRTFRATRDDGLLDIVMAAFVSMFALAPMLSAPLGDFWSSAIFGPIWFTTYLVVRYLHSRVVVPRVGSVEPGPDRRNRMRRVAIALWIVNLVAFAVVAAAARGVWSDWLDLSGMVYPIVLGFVALVGLSLAAYALSVWRYAVYGLLVAVAPLVGEWLWQQGRTAHHGFPIAFGSVALIMLITGVTKFANLIRSHPLPADAVPG
jgi:hypothetical protein